MSVLFVGDSQLKHLHNVQLEDNTAVRFISGFCVEQMWNLLSAIVQDHDTVVIHAGTNNVPREEPATSLHRYQHQLKIIWTINPTARIDHSVGRLVQGSQRLRGSKEQPWIYLWMQQESTSNQRWTREDSFEINAAGFLSPILHSKMPTDGNQIFEIKTSRRINYIHLRAVHISWSRIAT